MLTENQVFTRSPPPQTETCRSYGADLTVYFSIWAQSWHYETVHAYAVGEKRAAKCKRVEETLIQLFPQHDNFYLKVSATSKES